MRWGSERHAQAILAVRLLFQTGQIRRVLIVCPKPLVFNWSRELKLWASDLPFEVIGGDTEARRATWTVSNCPLKLVNYEILTRDADLLKEDGVHFDLVVLDEAQRIKNHDSKTAQVVRGIPRSRSWALTGTPIENRPEDLVNIFAFRRSGPDSTRYADQDALEADGRLHPSAHQGGRAKATCRRS